MRYTNSEIFCPDGFCLSSSNVTLSFFGILEHFCGRQNPEISLSITGIGS